MKVAPKSSLRPFLHRALQLTLVPKFELQGDCGGVGGSSLVTRYWGGGGLKTLSY